MQYQKNCRLLQSYAEITENRLTLLMKILSFILIPHIIDLLPIQQVLRHIQRICLTIKNKLSLQDLLMICKEKAQRLLKEKNTKGRILVMKQKDYVINAMVKNGGYATFQQLNQLVDFNTWGTKTPFASIRRIVQTNDEFFKVQPGLWALKKYENDVLKKFRITEKNEKSIEEFTHSYYQGIIVEIGNLRQHKTYVPPQDKNKMFLETKLSKITTIDKIYDFTYPEILRKAKTVDTIWFNERNMPCAFYEVEHSTDIKNSLNKFYELQDFRAKILYSCSQGT